MRYITISRDLGEIEDIVTGLLQIDIMSMDGKNVVTGSTMELQSKGDLFRF